MVTIWLLGEAVTVEGLVSCRVVEGLRIGHESVTVSVDKEWSAVVCHGASIWNLESDQTISRIPDQISWSKTWVLMEQDQAEG